MNPASTLNSEDATTAGSEAARPRLVSWENDDTFHPCTLCDTPVRRVPFGARDWQWVDADGRAVGVNSMFACLGGKSPYTRLAELADIQDRYREATKKSPGTVSAGEYGAAVAEYTSLRVWEAQGTSSWHTHYAAPPPPDLSGLPAVSHCDYPAYRAPAGWECRRCHASLGDDAAVGWTR